jgi:branched-chain amino acid transport system substrate-binding protein
MRAVRGNRKADLKNGPLPKPNSFRSVIAGASHKEDFMLSKSGRFWLSALAVGALGALAVATAAFARPEARAPAAASAPRSADAAAIACGRTRSVGIAAPLTGLAASLGQQQLSWARYFVTRWNRANPRSRLRLVQGDTRLPDTAAAIRVAQNLAGNSRVLGVVGPAGSQEVQVSTAALRNGGVVNVSPSATRTSLTDGSRRGYFYRVVPNDDQQGPRVANYIRNVLRAQRVVVVDDQEAYGQGLSNTVQPILERANIDVRRESINPANTTDFSALVARIPTNTQVVYIPWQLSSKAQQFGQQLRANGRNAVLFGSDGLFDPDNFRIRGSYVSFFPINLRSPLIAAYRRSHGNKSDLFGAPAYEAMNVLARAITRACRDNNATRAEVRRLVRTSDIPLRTSVLGIRVRFTRNGDVRGNFGIYRIAANGAYNRVS